MTKLIALIFLIGSVNYVCSQKKIATATTNQNIIDYVHSVDSTIIVIDFLEIMNFLLISLQKIQR